MKLRFFTFLVSFLMVMSGAVWGQKPHDISTGNLEINDNDTYVVTGTTKENSITINGGTPTIKLNGVNIDKNGKSGSAMAVNAGTVYLQLEGGSTNAMISGHAWAGIYVAEGATLIIDGEGSLRAECDVSGGFENALGAGIGGDDDNPDFGTIWIKGGTIYARSMQDGEGSGHVHAAGIGGGESSQFGTIIITGGNVTAICQDDNGASTLIENQKALGAAIGGGWKGTCDAITILGGKINAQNIGANQKGYNIGRGYEAGNKTAPSVIIGLWVDGQ